MPHKPGIGAIFGITSEDGVAMPKRVLLIDRSNFNVVAQTVSNSDGGYVFAGLNPDTNDYLVIGVDDDGAPPKEAIIHDYIQPIPAHQGATWLGNYEKVAMALAPTTGSFGHIDSTGALLTVSSRLSVSLGTSVTTGLPPMFSNAPHLPTTRLNGAAISLGNRSIEAVLNRPDLQYGYRNSPAKLSLEWAFRRSSVPVSGVYAPSLTLWGEGSATNVTETPDQYSSYIATAAIAYNAATNTLECRLQSGAFNNYGYGDCPVRISHSMSAYPDDVHCVFTARFADVARLYVNGNLVASFSLSGMAAKPGGNYDQYLGATVCGVASTYGGINVPTTVLFGPAMAYDHELTAADVSNLYNALTVASTPLETGYAREVLTDHPLCYYRLNENSGAAYFSEWLTREGWGSRGTGMTIVNPANVSFQQTSPVVGQGAVKFGGASGARSDRSIMSSCSRVEFSVEFFFEPTTLPIGQGGRILLMQDPSSVPHVGVLLTTQGKLTLSWRESNVAASCTFGRVFLGLQRRHVAITMNKIAQKAALYVDGVLEEEQTVTGTVLNVQPYWVGEHRCTIMVGGEVNAAFNAVANPFSGVLHEVAFYPHALPASRIQAHFDAAGVV